MRVLPAETVMAIQERILAGASIRQIMGRVPGVAKGTVSRYRGIVLGKSIGQRGATSCEPSRHDIPRYDKNRRLQKDVDRG